MSEKKGPDNPSVSRQPSLRTSLTTGSEWLAKRGLKQVPCTILYDYFPAGENGQREKCWKAWVVEAYGEVCAWGFNGDKAAKTLAESLDLAESEYTVRFIGVK